MHFNRSILVLQCHCSFHFTFRAKLNRLAFIKHNAALLSLSIIKLHIFHALWYLTQTNATHSWNGNKIRFLARIARSMMTVKADIKTINVAACLYFRAILRLKSSVLGPEQFMVDYCQIHSDIWYLHRAWRCWLNGLFMQDEMSSPYPFIVGWGVWFLRWFMTYWTILHDCMQYNVVIPLWSLHTCIWYGYELICLDRLIW